MNVPSTPPAEQASSATVPSASSSLALPRTFGRYTLFELIGKGGMAEIFLARAETDLGATRLAVVKQILPAFADDPRFEEMLTHEAKLAARLSHARVVQVFDLGRAEGHLFIAMEYVEGYDLNALLRQCTERKVGLPVEHALGIVADVLEGLDYAHRLKAEDGAPLGLVHRDVSPSNILISYEGEVKLCDFGIAHANDLVREGASEALKGKAGYMSPEHARGETLDARADVFAAGIVLWELLSGHRLYRPKGEESLLEQARRAEIPPLPEKGLPNAEELAKIVGRALAADREERYPSALAMLRDLEGYLAKNHLLASRLKLGEWMSSSFGTELVERRRASERKLPKSTPPPRSTPPRARPGSSPRIEAAAPPEKPHAERSFELTPSDVPPAVRGLVALAPPMVSPRASQPPSEEIVAAPPAPESAPAAQEMLAAVPAAPGSTPGAAPSSPSAVAEAAPSERALPPAEESAPQVAPAEGSEPQISEGKRRPISLVPVSSGAMRAFKRELEDARQNPVPPMPESLVTLDISPPSSASPDRLANAEPPAPSRARSVLVAAVLVLVVLALTALFNAR